MDRSLLEKIVSSTILKKSREYYGDDFSITFTGGEPFARNDFNEVFSFVDDAFKASAYTISTNGIRTKQITDFMKKHSDKGMTFHISIDGLREKHDKHRGVVGSFQAANATITELEKTFEKMKIKIKFTITPENYNEILDVYELSKKLGTEFGIKPVENAINYTNPEQNNSERFKFNWEQVNTINDQLKVIMGDLADREKESDALFILDTIRFLEKKKGFLVSCNSPRNSVFVMPNGEMFSCLHFETLGNLFSKGFDQIWDSKKSEEIINKAGRMDCLGCASYHGSYSNYQNMLKQI
jgi:MoaA/NifB/PqqE/SkfB family radical SAM enzyme